jgi:SulP family sulfate permease
MMPAVAARLRTLAYLVNMGLLVGADASVMPIYFYALFGSSRQLAVGPVALVSLLVESALR